MQAAIYPVQIILGLAGRRRFVRVRFIFFTTLRRRFARNRRLGALGIRSGRRWTRSRLNLTYVRAHTLNKYQN